MSCFALCACASPAPAPSVNTRKLPDVDSVVQTCPDLPKASKGDDVRILYLRTAFGYKKCLRIGEQNRRNYQVIVDSFK